ncbi:MAG: hypothetical protein R2688_00760 [Fimbriimonadaceae bacterium]
MSKKAEKAVLRRLKPAISIFGTETRTNFLLALHAMEPTYVAEIARVINASQENTKFTSEQLIEAGIVTARQMGRTKVLEFNNRFFAVNQLRALLAEIYMTDSELQRKVNQVRKRPRRTGKEV